MTTELLGRGLEQEEVRARLASRRLVTVVGPGGVGKTALARAVAARAGDGYPLGVHAVDLTQVSAPAELRLALAGQLGFPSFEALLGSPTDAPALVLLDSCEHVLDAVAEAVTELLDACPSPTFLATSRSPLDLPGESLVPLAPLALPAPGLEGSSPAVQLFLSRAEDAGAPILEQDLAIVAELCRQLDGMPLAIELAAARARTFGPAGVLSRLRDGVDVLTRPRFRGHARHRSVESTVAWSYRLLTADEADLFTRLGVVPGPFSESLAVAMAADLGLGRAEAEWVLASLVDASLVVVERAGAQVRYRLYEVIRSFARQRLDESGARAVAEWTLVDHVLGRVDELRLTSGVSRQEEDLRELLDLYPHLTTAIRLCLERDDPERGLPLYSALWVIAPQRHTREIADLGTEVLQQWSGKRHPRLADAYATAAEANALLAETEQSLRTAREGLAVLERLPEASPTAAVTLRRTAGYATYAGGDVPGAAALFDAVARLAREAGLWALALEADVTRGQLRAGLGDLTGGLALVTAAEEESRRRGSQVNRLWAQAIAAHLAVRRDPAAGLPAARAALDEARRHRYPAGVTTGLFSVGLAATALGDHAAAASALHELVENMVVSPVMVDLRTVLEATAALLHAAGRPAWADLAATARRLPVAGTFTGVSYRVNPVPEAPGTALGRRDALILARNELQALPATTGGTGSAPRPTSPAPEEPATDPVTPVRTARLVRRGDVYEVEFDGRQVHARATKGLDDLARLLGTPGQELHCLDLMGAGVHETAAGEILDDTARRAYQRKVRDLQQEIADAEDAHDTGRADIAQAELDALVEQLTAAFGLGGRSRGTGSSVERARSAVTQRLRASLRRLGELDPGLGRHLEASVSTGTFCCYRPEHPVDWTL